MLYNCKIRTTGADKKSYEFTSQLFFDDALSDSIFSVAPYKRNSVRDTRNNNDMHYADIGSQLLLKLDNRGAGYNGVFNIGLDLANMETGKASGFSAERGRGRAGAPGGRARCRPPGRGRGR